MGARGDLGHHAAIGPMLVELAEDDIGQDFARSRRGSRAPPRRRFRRSSSRCPGRSSARKSSRPLIGSRQPSLDRLPSCRKTNPSNSEPAAPSWRWCRPKWCAPPSPRTGAPCEIVHPQNLGRPHPGPPARRCRRQGPVRQGTRRRASCAKTHRSRRAFDEGRADGSAATASRSTAFLPREDPSEAFLSHKARTSVRPAQGRADRHQFGAPPGAGCARCGPISTSSCLRGNVDTRLRKLDERRDGCDLPRALPA